MKSACAGLLTCDKLFWWTISAVAMEERSCYIYCEAGPIYWLSTHTEHAQLLWLTICVSLSALVGVVVEAFTLRTEKPCVLSASLTAVNPCIIVRTHGIVIMVNYHIPGEYMRLMQTLLIFVGSRFSIIVSNYSLAVEAYKPNLKCLMAFFSIATKNLLAKPMHNAVSSLMPLKYGSAQG